MLLGCRPEPLAPEILHKRILPLAPAEDLALKTDVRGSFPLPDAKGGGHTRSVPGGINPGPAEEH